MGRPSTKGVSLVPRLLVLVVVALFASPGAVAADQVVLIATVGPGPTISMTDASGARLVNIQPGTYDIVVRDRATEHNFHLSGPGVDRATEVEALTEETWTVTLADGTYRFVCDPHAGTMRGTFTVGTPPTTTPPPTRLTATVGPGFTISVRNAAGRLVRTVNAGRFRITVRDRSRLHNFHLIGPGVNKRTGVAFRGTTTWTLRLRAGTYRFVCDPHRTRMKGSFRAR
jgi:plastocyanin